MKISELIKLLEDKMEEYGDVEVETQPYETVVIVLEGEEKNPEMVEYRPLLSDSKSFFNPNARKIGVRLDNVSIIMDKVED